MIHFKGEGECLNYGLNIERVRDRGWAFVLYWRGFDHVYMARIRFFTKERRAPRVSWMRAWL